MPRQAIQVGEVPGDGQGTPLRNAMIMINEMTQELYGAVTALQEANLTPADGQTDSLTFELLSVETNITGVKTFHIPKIPGNFAMADVFLTTNRLMIAEDLPASITARLKQDAVDAAVIIEQEIPDNGVRELTRVAPLNVLVAGAYLTLETTVVLGDPDAPDPENDVMVQGLFLWIRGVWMP